MKELLLKVDYTDSTRKFWCDSSIKNMTVEFDPDKQTIHELIKEVCDERDGMKLSYKGKPQGNVYRDVKDANGKVTDTKIVGYMYRGKIEIFDRNMTKPVTALFDVWVTIKFVEKFEFEVLDV
jgi:hypothetical protein